MNELTLNFPPGRHRDLFLSGHTRPACPRAGQTRVSAATPAAASTLTTWSRWLGERDTTFPTADQTRDDVAQRDGPRPASHAPCTGLLRLNSLRLTHLSLSFERFEEISFSGSPRSPSSVDFAIIILRQVNLEVVVSRWDCAPGLTCPRPCPSPRTYHLPGFRK
jgi:hypothetical protein